MAEYLRLAEKEHIANIRAESPDLMDTNIIDLYVAQQAVSEETNLDKIQQPARAMALPPWRIGCAPKAAPIFGTTLEPARTLTTMATSRGTKS